MQPISITGQWGKEEEEEEVSRDDIAHCCHARWLVNVSRLTRDLPPTITHSHPLHTDCYFDPTPPWAGLFVALFFPPPRLTSFRVRTIFLFLYPYPRTTLTFRPYFHGKVFAKEICRTFQLRPWLNASRRVLHSVIFTYGEFTNVVAIEINTFTLQYMLISHFRTLLATGNKDTYFNYTC